MAKVTADPWHYARPQLAEGYLATYELGLQSARGIFAKRRMGKTEFLKKDLLPLAHRRGYLTAYANLWDAQADPALAIMQAIGKAIEPHGWAAFVRGLKTPVRKIKASGKVAGFAEGGIEAELEDGSGRITIALSDVLQQVDKTRKKLLLAIDEAQVLTAAGHANFTHALRAGLDVRKDTIKVIFAGSSEGTLRRMFARPSQPFYNWAPLEPFQLLGAEFVEAMATRANGLSKYPLSMQQALNAFHALQDTPDFFRRFLDRYLTHAQLGADTALAATREAIYDEQDFAGRWKAMLPVDREMLRLLIEGGKDLHGHEARARLAKVIGRKTAVPMHTSQNALQRLAQAHIITRLDRGEYALEDDAFIEWVRQAAE